MRHSLSERIIRTPGTGPRRRHILTLDGISAATEKHSAAIQQQSRDKTRDPSTND